jgi:hypothetical protein
MAEFVGAFKGLYESICAPTFAPALQQIARAIGQVLSPKCVQGPFVDKDPGTPGVQYDCAVTDRQFQADGTEVGTLIPSCDGPHQGKCWALAPDPANCPGADQLVLQFTPPPDPSVSSLYAVVSCAVCIPGSADPGCR